MTQSLTHLNSTYSTTEEVLTVGSLPGPHGCYRTPVPPAQQPVQSGSVSEPPTTTAGSVFDGTHKSLLTGHTETEVPPTPIAIPTTIRSVTSDTHPNPSLLVTTLPISASVNDADDADSGGVPSMYYDCVASDAGSRLSSEQTFYDTVSSHPANSTPGSPSRDRCCPISTAGAGNGGQGVVSSTVVYVSTPIKTSEECSVVGRRHSHTETGGFLLPRKAAGALRELLQTEDRFVKAMEDFIHGYLYSVRFTRQATGNDLLQHLLHHLVPLVDFHAEFYRRLTGMLKISSDDGQPMERITTADLQKVVDLFTTSQTEFNVYLPYCTVIRNFSSEAKILEKSHEWLRFTKQDQQGPGGRTHPRRSSRLSLQEFLMRPIQRLCLYPLLLKEVAKHLPVSHPSIRADLEAAIEMIRSLTVGINEARRTQEVHYQTQQLYRRYEDTPRLPLSFLRRLGDIVLAGALEVLAYDTLPLRIKYYACIMLPGFLLVMKTKSATVYEPKYWFPMETMHLTDLAPDASPVSRHTNSLPSMAASRPSPYSRTLSWRLTHENTQKSFDFFAACPEEKDLWWKHLQQATLTASKQNSGYRYCSCVRTRAHTSMVTNGPVRRPSMTPSSLWSLHSLRWGSSLGAHGSTPNSPSLTDPHPVPSAEFSPLSSSPQTAAHVHTSLDLTDVNHFPNAGSAGQESMSPSTSTLYHPGSSRKSLVDSRFGDMFTHDCLRSRAKALAALGATGAGVSIHNLPVALPPTPVSSAPSTPLSTTAPSLKLTSSEGTTETQPPWVPLGTTKDKPQSGTEEVVKNRRAASDGAMIKRRQTALANQRQTSGRGAERSRSSLATFRHRPLLSQPRPHHQRMVTDNKANETVERIHPQTHTEQDRSVPAPGLLLGRNNGGNRSQRLIHILGRLAIHRHSAWPQSQPVSPEEVSPLSPVSGQITRNSADTKASSTATLQTRDDSHIRPDAAAIHARRQSLGRSKSMADIGFSQPRGVARTGSRFLANPFSNNLGRRTPVQSPSTSSSTATLQPSPRLQTSLTSLEGGVRTSTDSNTTAYNCGTLSAHPAKSVCVTGNPLGQSCPASPLPSYASAVEPASEPLRSDTPIISSGKVGFMIGSPGSTPASPEAYRYRAYSNSVSRLRTRRSFIRRIHSWKTIFSSPEPSPAPQLPEPSPMMSEIKMRDEPDIFEEDEDLAGHSSKEGSITGFVVVEKVPVTRSEITNSLKVTSKPTAQPGPPHSQQLLQLSSDDLGPVFSVNSLSSDALLNYADKN
ncbi:hypothetical protein IWQ62_002862 [Dispira parvispora]|uniref:DH domain-containing protein n=1 Tax=Dispira parvispora TaxID=1520584 RepID=A0A9W8AP31_9FUNG|nr:hypothetical protein IWQ62_002862 [Dispira parvispora]